MADLIISAVLLVVIGIVIGYWMFHVDLSERRYRIRGKTGIYKENKTVTESWADGLVKYEYVELVEDKRMF